VGGSTDEWDLVEDFFADMYRAGKPDKKVESELFLRYDCSANPGFGYGGPTGTIYALVLAVEGAEVIVNEPPATPEDAYIKIVELGNVPLVDGNSGNDGSPPDFKWVGLDGTRADGWEASFTLNEDTYTLNVHTQVFDDSEQQTSAVADRGIPLLLQCDGQLPPPPMTVLSTTVAVIGLIGAGLVVLWRRQKQKSLS